MKSPLYQRLKKLQIVQALSSDKWDEAETLAYSLEEILESLGKLAPMCKSLIEDANDDHATEVLQEIAEELGHIAYHLNDSKLLRVVADRHREPPEECKD